MKLVKGHPLLSIVNSYVIDSPAPSNHTRPPLGYANSSHSVSQGGFNKLTSTRRFAGKKLSTYSTLNKVRLIQANPYHLVEPSPWPIAASFALLTTTVSGVMSFHGYANGGVFLTLGVLATVATMFLWWRDVVAEGTFQGDHTLAVQKGLSIGVLLFIISEVMFFISIFWAYFHSSLAPAVELGAIWPPKGIEAVNPFELPLLNTIILLSSGATVTYAHHSLISGNRTGTIRGLTFTLILAFIFTYVQAYEYYNAPFNISDSVYGSTFFFSTGFHGLHVIIGSIFLIVALIRVLCYHLTEHHHVGFEGAIAYWHFVDVVWLFLFIAVYWWGSE